ncbi:MAG: CBS domain-containing protein [Chloroflexaceae bacterium]|jgi:CBS domain-containing protein|nr:CBS domain-containing protein [Chloroflexaceae bacterium]
MKRYRVVDWMSAPAVVIPSSCPLATAHDVMEQRHIRRLPVVDDGELVGMVTVSDLRAALPSTATTLSVYEEAGLVERIPVAECMTRRPQTVAPDTPVLEAARQMLQHKIGALPVVANGRVIGIITESDLFRLLVADLSDVQPEDTRHVAVVCGHCGTVLRGHSPANLGPDDTCWHCHYHLHRCQNCQHFDGVACMLNRDDQLAPVPGQHCPAFSYTPPASTTPAAAALR